MSPAAVTVVASNRLIPVLAQATCTASIVPPCSLTRLAICIEKSIPTPTSIEPTITVTSDSGTPSESIASHCIATVKPTGIVVNKANLRSRNTKPRVRTVNSRAKPNDVH